jgi:uncharacterized protein YjbI with pentapeptide repeats
VQANLGEANLSRADLRSAGVCEANLVGAKLVGVEIQREGTWYHLEITPRSGSKRPPRTTCFHGAIMPDGTEYKPE